MMSPTGGMWGGILRHLPDEESRLHGRSATDIGRLSDRVARLWSIQMI